MNLHAKNGLVHGEASRGKTLRVRFLREGAVGTALLLSLLLWTTAAYAAKPWPAREPSFEPKPAHQLRNLATWPPEPNAPEVIEEEKFQAAFARLCSVDEDGAIASLAPDVLAAAKAEVLDPFLLAALAFTRSGCNPKFDKRKEGVGLLGIDAAMYRVPGAPLVPVERKDLSKRRLMVPAQNLAVGAKLLKMWQETHLEADQAFGGAPHRDAVSHFVWGDRVCSSGQEDLVLTARRRMLLAYAGATDTPRDSKYGIKIVSPLEAPPRVATSGPGDERDGGARQHRGLDLTASIGEPVRAVADGTVWFAGANLPGRPRTDDIPPSKIKRYARRRLGVGGIYMCIDHDDAIHKIVSCYMHLSSYVVGKGEDVRAGQIIGYVGNTGVKVSPPHLHFEIRVDERFTNPLRTLGDLAIPPKATMTHMYMLKAKRAKYRASAERARAAGRES
jgi:murein DD-endopeptidase MepM/ murein hydrolase activator NlpD